MPLCDRVRTGLLQCWRYRSGRRPYGAAEQVSSPRRSSRFRFPLPQCLQKCGNSNREVHRLSRFSDHQTACSCSREEEHRRPQADRRRDTPPAARLVPQSASRLSPSRYCATAAARPKGGWIKRVGSRFLRRMVDGARSGACRVLHVAGHVVLSPCSWFLM
jgi:hypothetical protein